MNKEKKAFQMQQLLDSLSILVVDDSRFDRELAVSVLRKIGIQNVQIAENGSIAGSKIRNAQAVRKNFDLILLDAKMPSQDGASLLKWIRQSSKLKDQFVIMTTGSSDLSHVVEYASLGINGYIVKPLTLEVLKNKIFEIFYTDKENAG